MSHPAWKRSYVVRAMKLRRSLTEKALFQRIGVPVETMRHWIKLELARKRK
jgi:hypothetical protein